MLGVLRTDDSEAALAPQPGLDQLGALAAHVREAGVAVEVRVDGPRDGIPAGVELAAYRIVQEALTNVLKHASASHAVVRVGYRPDAIELRSWTTATGPRRRQRPARATGLIGMRERVSLYGGWLRRGPAQRFRGPRPAAGQPSGRRSGSLVADDQALVRSGFRMILEAQPDIEVVGEAADGREAVAAGPRPAPTSC